MSGSFHLAFVQPFVIDPAIDWVKASLQRGAWYGGAAYADGAIEDEFRRYVFRDCTTMICGIIYAVGATVLTSSGIVPFPFAVAAYEITLAFIGLCTCALDAHFCFFRESTAGTAKIRAAIALAQGAIATLMCCTGVLASYHVCDNGTDLFGFLWSRPIMTPARRFKYCVISMDTYSTLTSTMALAMIKTTPVAHVGLGVFNVLAYVTSRYYMPVNTEPTGNIWAKNFLVFMFTATTLAYGVARTEMTRRQFERAVDLEKATRSAAARQEEVNTLLSDMLPATVLTRLLNGESNSVDFVASASVMYSDVVQFTKWSSSRTARDVAGMLNELCISFDACARQYAVEKIKTIGDAYWAVAGIPDESMDHAERLCNFAQAILSIAQRENRRHVEWAPGIQLRIGVHSGPVAGGMLGNQQLSYEVFGSTTHLAEEVEQMGVPGHVAVSAATAALLPPGAIEESFRLQPIMIEHADGASSALPLFVLTASSISRSNTPSDSNHMSADSTGGSVRHTQAAVGASDGGVDRRLRKQRQEFINARAARRGAMMPSEDDLKDILNRFSTRKYGWVFLDFLDPEVEHAYGAFARYHYRHVHILLAALFPAVILGLLLAVGIEGSGVTALSLGLVLGAAGVALGLVAVAVLLQRQVVADKTEADATATAVSSPAAAIATADVIARHVLGGALAAILAQLPFGAVSNDVGYVPYFVTCLSALPTVSIGSLAILLCNIVVLAPVTFYFAFDSQWLFSHTALYIIQMLITWLMAVSTEKMLRRSFLEAQVAHHYTLVQQTQVEGQASILSSLVPTFVLSDLMAWLATDLHPGKSIVIHYDHLCVGFLRLDPATVAGVVDFDDQDDVAAARGVMALQQTADAVFARLRCIVKIKTIGDIVLLAGPFDDRFGVELAAAELTVASVQLRSHVYKAGLNVGPAVGAVMGTARLCFDVFGDTVNTCSRAMSTASDVRCISATTVFADAVEKAYDRAPHVVYDEVTGAPSGPSLFISLESATTGDNSPTALAAIVRFGETEQRVAKGKGVLHVRRLLSATPNAVVAPLHEPPPGVIPE